MYDCSIVILSFFYLKAPEASLLGVIHQGGMKDDYMSLLA